MARLETSFVIYSNQPCIRHVGEQGVLTTSTPRLRATAMTVFSDPRSTPTTDMFACVVSVAGY